MVKEEDEEKEEEPVELETSRSGRVRKKPKFRYVRTSYIAENWLIFNLVMPNYFTKIIPRLMCSIFTGF